MAPPIQWNSLPPTYQPMPKWRKNLSYLMGVVSALVIARSLSTWSFSWGSAVLGLAGAIVAYRLFPSALDTADGALKARQKLGKALLVDFPKARPLLERGVVTEDEMRSLLGNLSELEYSGFLLLAGTKPEDKKAFLQLMTPAELEGFKLRLPDGLSNDVRRMLGMPQKNPLLPEKLDIFQPETKKNS